MSQSQINAFAAYAIRAVPEQSDLAYALRTQAYARYRAALALHTLAHELERITTSVTDPGVARVKLAWWHNALKDAIQGIQPEHPILVELRETHALSCLSLETVNRLCEAVMWRLSHQTFSNAADQIRYHTLLGGTVFELVATCLEPSKPALIEIAQHQGALWHCLHTPLELQADALRELVQPAIPDVSTQRLLHTLYFMPLLYLASDSYSHPNQIAWPLKKLWLARTARFRSANLLKSLP